MTRRYHLGYYKSLMAIISRLLIKEDRKCLEEVQEDIMFCYIGIINYGIKHQDSLEQWKTIMNIMLYKEPGNLKIRWLCVIHIYEADMALM